MDRIIDFRDPVQKILFFSLAGGLPVGGITYLLSKKKKRERAIRNAMVAGLTSGFLGYFAPDITKMYKAIKEKRK